MSSEGQFPAPLIDFVDESDVPVLNTSTVDYHEQVDAFRSVHTVQFDPEYLTYLRIAHGRLLRNCWFHDDEGKQRQLQRVFSFANKSQLPGPFQLSWRHTGSDIRLDYSVPYFESMMSNWNESSFLIPFLGVNNEERDEYDMLCLYYEFIPRPTVALWEHGENPYPESKRVRFIAKDFSAIQAFVFGR